jgi:hypothetical protein
VESGPLLLFREHRTSSQTGAETVLQHGMLFCRQTNNSCKLDSFDPCICCSSHIQHMPMTTALRDYFAVVTSTGWPPANAKQTTAVSTSVIGLC